ncbi:ankyrin repeat-containing domain protein [Aspergillus aurantiobrunneus]
MESGNTSVIQLILNAGADQNHPNAEGSTPLHWLVATQDRPDLVQLLVDFGAAINACDIYGDTALMIAVQHGRPRSARKLIECGVNIDEVDEEGWTALNMAIFLNIHSCLDILLEAQASCEHITGDGSILHFAAKYADLRTLQALLRHSTHVRFPVNDKRQEYGLTALEIAKRRTATDEWHLTFLKPSQDE